ncbi:hypothetical protein NLG97_g5733 [Lecanicillium saksenae]|uniref:Uncharacterized protein n=1 Tax=Lecanicillium saksenae TaxID=468837 RepID=A0ACC1QU64_9HYPO|nr:hypothetical protein NLG97_g5733 [Lecanicillium saksenae]
MAKQNEQNAADAFDSQFLSDQWSAVDRSDFEHKTRSSSSTGSGAATATESASPRFDDSSLFQELLQGKCESPYGINDFVCTENYTTVPPSFENTTPSTSSAAAAAAASSDGRLRCFDHGCGGRTFSSPENYRRHVRERERPVDAVCMFCLAFFTRKSNRDQHILSGKCKMSNSGRHD